MAESSNDDQKELKVDPLEMQALQASVNQLDTKKQIKGKYAFWETQPVAQFKEDISSQVALLTYLVSRMT
jgi:hypothetical protein